MKSFFLKIGKDRVYNYSASSAFFLILSIFPFLILIMTVIQYTPLTKEFLVDRLQFLLPDPIFPLLQQIIEEIYSTTYGAAIISVSALGGIWSASKGVMSMIRGINTCFNINDKRSWIHVRLLSCLYTIVTIIVLIFTLILLVFGSTIYGTLLAQSSTEMSNFLNILMFLVRRRFVIGLVILTLIFMLIYKFLPAKNNKFFQMFPGAVLASLAWVGLSEVLSIYIKAFPNFSVTYGSLTSFIVLMLYLYFGMYIVFICAEINFFFKSALEKAHEKRQRKKALKYETHLEKKQMKYETQRLKKEEKEMMKQKQDQTKVYHGNHSDNL
ncbi:MAG: YihY family inner membrane protein [Parasporobacterium sp.]|nr:YihY family inner membrane protein [Parasporobacterium sp.]